MNQSEALESAPRNGETPPEKTRAAESRRRIVIIEDDRDIADAMSYALDRAGFSVRIARTGEEGLDAVRKGADLVLLDLNLPRLDGRELLRIVKADAGLCSIPVVVLTTSVDDHDVRDAYLAHANAFISKPADFDLYVRTLRALQDFWFSAALLPPQHVV